MDFHVCSGRGGGAADGDQTLELIDLRPLLVCVLRPHKCPLMQADGVHGPSAGLIGFRGSVSDVVKEQIRTLDSGSVLQKPCCPGDGQRCLAVPRAPDGRPQLQVHARTPPVLQRVPVSVATDGPFVLFFLDGHQRSEGASGSCSRLCGDMRRRTAAARPVLDAPRGGSGATGALFHV